jgi:hypothetical protein
MKAIFHDFIKGSSTEKLSIISNFSTILGVSVATFVAGPFLSKFAGKQFIVSDFITAILFYFLCLWLVTQTTYSAFSDIAKDISAKKISDAIGTGVFFSLLVWVGTVFFPYAKNYTGDIFNNSYLLSTPANKAVVSINDFSAYKTENLLTLKGNIIFISEAVASDYEAVLYSKLDDSGVYRVNTFTNGESSFEFGKSGKFTIPINIKYDDINNIVLIIYRTSDWSLRNKLGSRSGFPENMTQLPNSETEELKAFTYIPKI